MNIALTNKHKNSHFANQTLQWLDLDSEENWQAHMQNPEQRQHLEKYGFDRPESVSYRMNNHGFRCDDFDNRPGFIALGCSFTCGIGLPADQVWPSMVGQVTGLVPWNLGIGAAGLDTAFRLLYHYIDVLDPKFVMLLIPDRDRFEIHHLGTPRLVMHSTKHPGPEIEIIKKFYFSDEQNNYVNHAKNMLAITQLCQSRQVKLIAKPLNPTLIGFYPPTEKWPASRDLRHVGYREHQRCADLFLEELNQN